MNEILVFSKFFIKPRSLVCRKIGIFSDFLWGFKNDLSPILYYYFLVGSCPGRGGGWEGDRSAKKHIVK